MNFTSFLSGKSQCACGRDHTCDIRFVELGHGVLTKLPEICSPFSHILLVADGNTYPLCGDQTKQILGNRICGEMIFGNEIVVPNEDAIAKIEAKLTNETDFIIGIGSGVINDLCKHVSFVHGLRYAIIATAPSMDGYASVGAALILEEMKVTLNARVPYAILAEDDVICTAPTEMLQSGYGDIVGKYSCLNDWKLAHLLREEYFCEFVYDRVMQTVKDTENTAKAILDRKPEAIRNLMEGLVMVGIMMSYVGNSRPASGSEHHLSHFFEITGLLENRAYYLHGIDVLYAAAVTAQLREKLKAQALPLQYAAPTESNRLEALRRIYSTASDGIIQLQEKVGFYKDLQFEKIQALWEQVCKVLHEAPSYEKMLTFVDAIGLNVSEFQAFYGESVISDAIVYAKDLKDRYTVLWLSYALGINSFEA